MTEEFDAEKMYGQLEAKLNGVLERYKPVSEERLNRLWGSVRETINKFSANLAEAQESRRLQNEAIASLAGEVQSLKQVVIMQTALSQGGMKVPEEESGGVVD
jgi:hypothetical protein